MEYQLKKKRFSWFKKIFASSLSLFFIYSIIVPPFAEAMIWQERRDAALRLKEKNHEQKLAGEEEWGLKDLPLQLAKLPHAPSLSLPFEKGSSISETLNSLKSQPLPFVKLPELPVVLPLQFSNFKRAYFPPKWKTTDPLILHIQDAHQNEEAQKNIANSLKALIIQEKISFVGLEGAFETIPLSNFRSYKDQESVRKVADYLLKENKISGAIHTALTSSKPIPKFIGIDDSKLYHQHVQAYKESVAVAENLKIALERKKLQIFQIKEKIYNPKLLALDQKVESYRKHEIRLGEYLKALTEEQKKVSQEISVFRKTLEMEEKLDFVQVESERKAMIQILVQKLSPPQMNQLLKNSVAYRLGHIQHAAFYDYLIQLCKNSGIDCKAYPAMEAYIRYILAAETISADKLIVELKQMERSAYESLSQSEQEKNLVAQSYELYLTEKLLKFEMGPEEWREYKNFSISNELSETKKVASFYEVAILRDEAMSAHLLKSIAQRDAKVAVFITGGFHSQGMEELLKKSNVAVITLAPKITRIESEKGTEYLSVFTQEKTPLEKLFDGEKLFVSQLMWPDRVRLFAASLIASFDPANAQIIFYSLTGSLGIKFKIEVQLLSDYLRRVILKKVEEKVAYDINLSKDRKKIQSVERMDASPIGFVPHLRSNAKKFAHSVGKAKVSARKLSHTVGKLRISARKSITKRASGFVKRGGITLTTASSLGLASKHLIVYEWFQRLSSSKNSFAENLSKIIVLSYAALLVAPSQEFNPIEQDYRTFLSKQHSYSPGWRGALEFTVRWMGLGFIRMNMALFGFMAQGISLLVRKQVDQNSARRNAHFVSHLLVNLVFLPFHLFAFHFALASDESAGDEVAKIVEGMITDVNAREMDLGPLSIDHSGEFMDVFIPSDPKIPYVIKVPKKDLNKVLQGYALSKKYLGGISAPMSLLRNVHLVIDGRTVFYEFVILQEKATLLNRPFKSKRVSLKAKRALIDSVYQLEKEMYSRGIHNPDHKINQSYGLDSNGNVVLTDFSHLSILMHEFYPKVHDDSMDMLKYNRNFFSAISPELSDHYDFRQVRNDEFQIFWNTQLSNRKPTKDIKPIFRDRLFETGLFMGVRELSPESSGAFTGQTSKALALNVGASYALIPDPKKGSSSLSGETNLTVARKIQRAVKGKGETLAPIIVVSISEEDLKRDDKGNLKGESLENRFRREYREKLMGFVNQPQALRNAAIVPQVIDKAGNPILLSKEDAHRFYSAASYALYPLLRAKGEIAQASEPHLRQLFQEGADRVRILLGGKTPERSELVDYLKKLAHEVDGIFIGSETVAKDPYGIQKMLEIISKFYHARAPTPVGALRGPPMTVVDFTKIHGNSSIQAAATIQSALAENPNLREMTTVLIPANLDLDRVGSVLSEYKLFNPGQQAEPTNLHFALQDLEDFSDPYLAQVKRDGYTYVLMGHSEVRRFFGVGDSTVNEQALAVIRNGLIPVIAIGERNRAQGDWKKGLHKQTKTVLAGISLRDLPKIKIAYEPIDFIGSGTSMSADQMQEANQIIAGAIREHIKEQGGASLLESDPIPVGILYGGSVKPSSVYGQSGGWERRTWLSLLRRLPEVIGGLIGTRSIIPGDPDRISDRFAENVLAKGKAVRGLSGGNWKMNIHTLEDAVRRAEAFSKNIRKNRWKGEFFFAVPASMGGALAGRFRGKYAPTSIKPLEWTGRQKAINRATNEFWNSWEDENQSSSIESLKQALYKLHELYSADEQLKRQGVSWYKIFSQALLSNLFANSKRLIPASQILISLRYAPLRFATDQIKDEKVKGLIQGVVGDKGTFHDLDKSQLSALYSKLARHFKLTEYESLLLRHVIWPTEILRSNYSPQEFEEVQRYWNRLLENASRALKDENVPLAGKISALWILRDIALNRNLDSIDFKIYSKAILALESAPSQPGILGKNKNDILLELRGIEDKIKSDSSENLILSLMEDLAYDNPPLAEEVRRLKNLYQELQSDLSSDTSDEEINSAFFFKQGLTESAYPWERQIERNLMELSDILQVENDPSSSVRDPRNLREILLEEIYFSLIWGGIRPYLIRKLKLARDEKKAPEAQPAQFSAKDLAMHHLAPILEDEKDEPYEVTLMQPVEIVLDVDGAFGKRDNLSIKNTAVQIVRRALGDKKGQGFNPNFEISTIYGINNDNEFQAFYDHLKANPYQGRFQFDLKLDKFQSNSEWIISIHFQGQTKTIVVKPGRYVSHPTEPRDVIFLTDQYPDDFYVDDSQRPWQEGRMAHVLNPELDPPIEINSKPRARYHNTGLTTALSPLIEYLDGALNHKLKQWELISVVPGESHILQKKSNQAARNLRLHGVKMGQGEKWESHTHEGAGYVQLNLILDEGIQMDVEGMMEILRSANLQGWPIYFAEGGWIPNSISVQEHDKPLILDKSISVQGNGRLVTIRGWIPDWVAADNILKEIQSSAEKREQDEFEDDFYLETLKQRQDKFRFSAQQIPQHPEKIGKKSEPKILGIYGGDEVVAGQLIKQLRGKEDIILKYIYVEETTENPLDTNVFAAYLRQIMPRSDIEIALDGDSIIINHSSPIKIIFSKALGSLRKGEKIDPNKVLPNWQKLGIDTVVYAHKAAEGQITPEHHRQMGAKNIVMATDEMTPVEMAVNLTRIAFADLDLLGHVVHTNSALDPTRDRGHDIVLGSKILPAPMANLLPKVMKKGYLQVQSSQYDAHLTAVTFTLDRKLTKEEVISRLKKAAEASSSRLKVLESYDSLRPSLVQGESSIYFDPRSVIVDHRTVTVLFGYDFANVWAAGVLDVVQDTDKYKRDESPERDREKSVSSSDSDKKPFKSDRKMVTEGERYIPAPVAKLKRESTGVYNRAAVEISDIPFDSNQRNPLDYFASSLVIDLMGDERLSVNFYGVKNVRDVLFLYHAIKKRLPEHVRIYLDGFDVKKFEKYKNDFEEHGYTYLYIQGAKIKISSESILENPKILNEDNIDSILVVSDDLKNMNAYEALKEPYHLNGVRHVRPSMDGLLLLKNYLKESLALRGLDDTSIRIFSTVPLRNSEFVLGYRTDGYRVETPTRLEGDLHNFVIEFDEELERDAVIALVGEMVRASGGRIEVTEESLASLDMVDNPVLAMISKPQITGKARLWAIPIWMGESGLAQAMIENLAQDAEDNPGNSKNKRQTATYSILPSIVPLKPKPRIKEMNGGKADLIISAVGGRTGKNMLLAAIGDPNVNILGVTLNKPTEEKVIATAKALNNDTVYGRPGIKFEYAGWDDKTNTFVIWAGNDEKGWLRIDVFDGSNLSDLERQIAELRAKGYHPIYLHAAGSGYHRFKEKDWFEIQGDIMIYGNPGKGESLLVIPGAMDLQNKALQELIRAEEILTLGSCTTGALAVALYFIKHMIDFVSAITLHELTNDQRLNHGPLHDVMERMFAAARTMLLSSSGAGQTIGKAMPELIGRTTAVALREGYGGASVVNVRIKLKPEFVGIPTEDVKEIFRQAYEKPEMSGIFHLHDKPYPIDSDEVKGYHHSSVLDLNSVRVNGEFLSFDAWYDNERGFSSRMIGLAKILTIIRRSEGKTTASATLNFVRDWLLPRWFTIQYTAEEYVRKASLRENLFFILAVASVLAIGNLLSLVFTGNVAVPSFERFNGLVWGSFWLAHLAEFIYFRIKGQPEKTPFGNLAVAGLVSAVNIFVLPLLTLTFFHALGLNIPWLENLTVLLLTFPTHQFANYLGSAKVGKSLKGSKEIQVLKSSSSKSKRTSLISDGFVRAIVELKKEEQLHGFPNMQKVVPVILENTAQSLDVQTVLGDKGISNPALDLLKAVDNPKEFYKELGEKWQEETGSTMSPREMNRSLTQVVLAGFKNENIQNVLVKSKMEDYSSTAALLDRSVKNKVKYAEQIISAYHLERKGVSNSRLFILSGDLSNAEIWAINRLAVKRGISLEIKTDPRLIKFAEGNYSLDPAVLDEIVGTVRQETSVPLRLLIPRNLVGNLKELLDNIEQYENLKNAVISFLSLIGNSLNATPLLDSNMQDDIQEIGVFAEQQ
ncbi:MAG: triose-phosphate isomerase [Elusimicrobia bacterium]|nr:triose-phosphate isomerase [Elusimicrobiota bacterium]